MCVPSVHVSKEEVPGRHSLDTLLQQRCDGWMEHDTVGPEVGYTHVHVPVAPGIAGMSMYYKSAEECR